MSDDTMDPANTGKILMNLINGTLDRPVMPPNFFGRSNP